MSSLYFAPMVGLLVPALDFTIIIEMVFFRIDARNDLDSKGRFSRGEVILVGINLSSTTGAA